MRQHALIGLVIRKMAVHLIAADQRVRLAGADGDEVLLRAELGFRHHLPAECPAQSVGQSEFLGLGTTAHDDSRLGEVERQDRANLVDLHAPMVVRGAAHGVDIVRGDRGEQRHSGRQYLPGLVVEGLGDVQISAGVHKHVLQRVGVFDGVDSEIPLDLFGDDVPFLFGSLKTLLQFLCGLLGAQPLRREVGQGNARIVKPDLRRIVLVDRSLPHALSVRIAGQSHRRMSG